MKIKIIDLSLGSNADVLEEALQALYDDGFRIIDIAGALRHLIILGQRNEVAE